MGVCNKGAGILAPLLFAAVILKSTDGALFKAIPLMGVAEREATLDALIRRVMLPYSCVGVILVGLGWMVRRSGLPEIETDSTDEPTKGTNLFQFPHLILGAVAIFLHVGTQVLAIDTIIGYAGSVGIALPDAKVFPSYVLMATILGYLCGIICIPRYISQARAFLICTILGAFFAVMIQFSEGKTVLGWLVTLGLANSLIWAGIWPLALDGLGRFTKLGASVMVMGLCGNAILPLVYGWLADRYGLREGYWILLPCYGYLIFYASYGHRIRNWAIFKTKAVS
jgi:fucose permease